MQPPNVSLLCLKKQQPPKWTHFGDVLPTARSRRFTFVPMLDWHMVLILFTINLFLILFRFSSIPRILSKLHYSAKEGSIGENLNSKLLTLKCHWPSMAVQILFQLVPVWILVQWFQWIWVNSFNFKFYFSFNFDRSNANSTSANVAFTQFKWKTPPICNCFIESKSGTASTAEQVFL